MSAKSLADRYLRTAGITTFVVLDGDYMTFVAGPKSVTLPLEWNSPVGRSTDVAQPFVRGNSSLTKVVRKVLNSMEAENLQPQAMHGLWNTLRKGSIRVHLMPVEWAWLELWGGQP